MKKILTLIATAAIFAACSNDKDLETNKDVVLTDTTGMYKSNYSTDVSPADNDKEEVAPAAQTKVIRETRVVYVDRTPKATRQTIREASPVEPVTAPVEQTQTSNTGTSTLPGTTTPGSTGTVGTNTGSETTTPAETEKKEGWSKAAKGAVIGGVGGAVAGAILSKKKGKGAIIGGVIGAAGGYILGRKKDKADEANNTPQYTSY
jgi:hypothetical protein